MAADKDNMAPGDWLSGYAYDGTNISVPRATLPELSAEEAAASTGSVANVAHALLEALYAAYAAIEPDADKPANFKLVKSLYYDQTLGTAQLAYTVLLRMDVAPGGMNVAAES